MKNKIIKISQFEKYLYIYWQLTDLCNFRCNYCNPSLHLGKVAKGIRPGFPSDQEILNFLDLLENLHLKNFDGKFHCNLSGGEPTLHPMFPSILERLANHGIISITTNCTRNVSWWKKLNKLPFEVQISLHPEFTKIEKVNETSNFLQDNGVYLFYNLMCDPNNWGETVKLYDQLEHKFKKDVVPKVLNRMDAPRDNREPWSYSEEQKTWMASVQEYHSQSRVFKKMPFKIGSEIHYENGDKERFNNVSLLTIDERNKHYNWKCSAGSRSININFDGKVYAGICKEQYLGHMSNFQLLEDFITCSKIYCVCPGDMKLEKYDPKFFQESI